MAELEKVCCDSTEIHEDLLKSAELTGVWEKKLREIEKRKALLATGQT